MRGQIIWEREVTCQDNDFASIKIHITESDQKKVKVADRRISYINPNRIGLDFDGFNGQSHDFIPNLSVADLIQLINRLSLLERDYVRQAIASKVVGHCLGVELDSRRTIDFDVVYNQKWHHDEIIIEYQDPLRRIERFEIPRISNNDIPLLIRALKEVYIEYDHITKKALLLGEIE